MFVAFLLVLGLALGSSVNALVWRLHEKKNWFNDRSECVNCHHKLSAFDLVPVFSWIWLRGRCRYCKKTISAQYPLVELGTAAIFLLSYYFWPVRIAGLTESILFAIWLIVSTGLVVLAVYDLRWMLLPTKIIYFLLLPAILTAILNILNAAAPYHAAFNYGLGCLIGGGVFYCLFVLSKGKWIGGGDVRLGFLLGLLAATPQRSLLLLFIASLLGTLVSLPLIKTRQLKRTSLIPFGPFLIAALFIIQFVGQDILHWYTSLFLI